MSVFNPCRYRPSTITISAVRGFKAVVQIPFLVWGQPYSAGHLFIPLSVHCVRRHWQSSVPGGCWLWNCSRSNMLHYTKACLLSYDFSLHTSKPDISNKKTSVIKKPPNFSKLINIVEKE